MKVLLIDVNCKKGSTGKIVYDLYTSLNASGNQASVCFGRGVKVNEPDIYRFGLDWETWIHAALTRLTGLTGCFSWFSTRRLLRYMNKFNPEVVHIHELHGYFVNIKSVINYLKKHDIKTIWTFHCEFMYTGKCGHAMECEKWKTECFKCPQLGEYPASLYFDFTRKMYNQKKKLFDGFNNLTIVTPSKWLANRVRQSFQKRKRIEVIFNGIDTQKIFHPRNYDDLIKKHQLTDEKIVLAVAPDLMSKSKGGRYVIELAKMMRNEKIKFILIGVKDVSEKFESNIIALGRTEDQIELAKYYSMADVFVICSEKETFSLTCAEALCCGTRIAGFESGAPESVFEKPFSQFVPFGNLVQLKDTLQLYLNVVENFSTECNKYGASNFSKEIMFQKYLKIYYE
jgi:putative colanic acid biosynthesis glycosyltransferase